MFKQKTAYEIRISDWSSDVCSSDLVDIAVLDGDIDVLLVETGKFGGNADLRVGLAKLDMRPGKVTADTAEAGYDEAAEDLVEPIGRASCRERVCQKCRSRWPPYQYKKYYAYNQQRLS